MPFATSKDAHKDERIIWQGDNVVLMDVHDLLPMNKNFPWNHSRRKKYYDIKDREITTAWIHQKAGGYTKGFKGVQNTAAFFARTPKYKNGKWIGNGRGWPAYGYTFDIPYVTDEINGRMVVYQCNPLDRVSWHTGGGNFNGVGVAFQGYFRSRHMGKSWAPSKGRTGEPSADQIRAYREFREGYLFGELGISRFAVKGHFEAPGKNAKAMCPGETLETMVLEDRNLSIDMTKFGPYECELMGDINLSKWEYRQAALVLLGMDIGGFGKLRNGVDGDPGEMTRLGVEAAERAAGLPRDGIWDPTVELAISQLLYFEGIKQDDLIKICP